MLYSGSRCGSGGGRAHLDAAAPTDLRAARFRFGAASCGQKKLCTKCEQQCTVQAPSGKRSPGPIELHQETDHNKSVPHQVFVAFSESRFVTRAFLVHAWGVQNLLQNMQATSASTVATALQCFLLWLQGAGSPLQLQRFRSSIRLSSGQSNEPREEMLSLVVKVRYGNSVPVLGAQGIVRATCACVCGK